MNRRTAFTLMLDAHAGQKDKAGEPYYFHPIAVEEAVAGLGEDFAVVALLHDVFEDTDLELADYIHADGGDEFLNEAQARALIAITQEKEEDYADYVRRVRRDFIASVVKWADFNHNLSPERQGGLHPRLAKHFAAKYERGRAILLGKE